MANSKDSIFGKAVLDGLFGELQAAYSDDVSYDLMLRDAHLGVALVEAGQTTLNGVDGRVAELIEKHRPT